LDRLGKDEWMESRILGLWDAGIEGVGLANPVK